MFCCSRRKAKSAQHSFGLDLVLIWQKIWLGDYILFYSSSFETYCSDNLSDYFVTSLTVRIDKKFHCSISDTKHEQTNTSYTPIIHRHGLDRAIGKCSELNFLTKNCIYVYILLPQSDFQINSAISLIICDSGI